MKTLWKIFAGLAVVTIVAVLWLCQKAGGMPLSALFLDAFLLTQMVDILLAMGLILVAVLPNGKGQLSGFLRVCLWALLGLGALVTLQRLMTIWEIARRVRGASLAVIAPSLAEGLVPLALGLLIAAIAGWKVASAKAPSPAANFD